MTHQKETETLMPPAPEKCDLLIIGGGITGAGIFHETTRLGFKVVLVEQHDFAWGTSSRSSKLIHGGLRYLKEGQLKLTRDAVRERERLLREAPGLVTPIAFLVPIYKNHGPGKWTLEAGLSLYDLMAKKRRHRFLPPEELLARVPFIDRRALVGGYEFWDAQVDDARLVLRLIHEGQNRGGTALNYTRAVSIQRDEQGHVCGATLEDSETHDSTTIETEVIINATGCWADKLHPGRQNQKHLRPLKGSHLIFPKRAIPVQSAVSFMHPDDGRALFAIPWEGNVLVGTTDLDYDADIATEPAMDEYEAEYLLQGLRALFPSLGLSLNECISSLAGVRPIISSDDHKSPSEESREHDIWVDHGLVTVAGGKLTTYRRVALDALRAAESFLAPFDRHVLDRSPFNAVEFLPPDNFSDFAAWQRLCGRYDRGAYELIKQAEPEDLEPIENTLTLWAELPFVIEHESVRHLSDLLLRRVRIGLLLPDGGKQCMRRIEQLCRPAFGWDKRRWRREVNAYLHQWQSAHGFPWHVRPRSFFQRLWDSMHAYFLSRTRDRMYERP